MTRQDKAKQVRLATKLSASTATNEQAYAMPSLYDPWVADKRYPVGAIINHEGNLYRCNQEHTSQEIYPPDIIPAIWTKIPDPNEEYPDWVQPLGDTGSYMTGSKVSHKGKKWVSTVDNNTWEPSVFGWEQVNE